MIDKAFSIGHSIVMCLFIGVIITFMHITIGYYEIKSEMLDSIQKTKKEYLYNIKKMKQLQKELSND